MIRRAVEFLIFSSLLGCSSGFHVPIASSLTTPLRAATSDGDGSISNVVVISPPGGVGQVAAVDAASMGSSVRWFVVNKDSGSSVTLEPFALEQIQQAGGSLQLAGASADDLLLSRDDPSSAVSAVSAWCNQQQASSSSSTASLICTLDGSDKVDSFDSAGRRVNQEEMDLKRLQWKSAIKVAAKEAARVVSGTKVAILSTADDDEGDDKDGSSSSKDGENEGGVGGLVGGLLGKKKTFVPASLPQALVSDDNLVILRHGQLFGTPESSPEFSALVGGPRKVPELAPEYTMRSVRVDPTASVIASSRRRGAVAAAAGGASSTQSSRHAVGEAAALVALQKVPLAPGMDVCLSSLTGTDPVPVESWKKEFGRVVAQSSSSESSSSSGTAAAAPVLFTTELGGVPNIPRLADWLATKWAPAVLRTYDIAAIRVGARPVYANRIVDKDENEKVAKLEIVWQQLVDFQSVTVGKMIIQVTDTSIVATRGPGDASKGFGSVTRKPLAGEDVLIRRLSEAASQAIEKGLADKLTFATPPPPKAAAVAAAKPPAPKPQPVVAAAAAATPATTPSISSSEQGPRQSGARRSTERTRGTRKRKSSPGSSDDDEGSTSGDAN